jgi:galactokinase
VALARSHDDQHHLYSEHAGRQRHLRARRQRAAGFGSYIEGCIRLVEAEGVRCRRCASSSRPTCRSAPACRRAPRSRWRCCARCASCSASNSTTSNWRSIAQRAEIDYARVNCGIMDQMASSLADESNMLFIDARTLEHRLVPMLPDTE